MAASGLFLFHPSGSVIAPLQHRPLMIAGAVEPIDEGDAGINISVMESHPEGVFCAINKYSPPVLAGDQIDVYWDGEKIFHKELQPEEIDGVFLFFFLPVEPMTPGWVEEVYYVLTRKDETVPDDPSAALRVLVKLDRPGGRDKEPHLPGHSELHKAQLPQDVIENGIDAEWAASGVPVTIPFYPGIFPYDVVNLHWGSVRIPHTVTPDQANRETPIIITVNQDAILAGGDSTALPVRYFPHDRVWNWAEKHSISTTVLVDAGAWRLESPIINDAVNGIITIKDLNKKDVTVLVKIAGDDFAIGDTVKLTWIGTPAVGKPLIHTQSRTVDNIPHHLEFKVPYAEVRAIAMGSADASYVLTKLDNSPPLSSKRAFADVIGDVAIIPEPIVEQAVGDTLEPDNEYATVRVSYPAMANGDYLNLIWLGTQANGQSYLHEEQHTVSAGEAADKLVHFYIDGQHIAVLDKGSLDLSYHVSNDAVALYGVSESERLLLKVEQLRATLPVPVVLEADPPDVLDPSKVFHNVNVRVNYLGTLPGDIVTCHWSGNGPFGSTSIWVPITTVTAGKPVTFRVAAEFVTANIGKYVKVRYTVKHAATGLFSYSITLNLLIGYLVGDLPPPEVTQAPNDVLNPMHALNGVDIKVSYESMDSSLDTIGLKWRGTSGPGTSEDQEQPGSDRGEVLFHLGPSFVGANINEMVVVGYDVKRYGYTTPSQERTLRVLGFQDPENELPQPQVTQAVDDVLDLMMFDGPGTVTVAKWPFIAVTQRAWLRLNGETGTGEKYSIELLDGEEISPDQINKGLSETLLRTELMKLGHTTMATVECRVAFSGGSEESTAEPFPVLPLKIRTRYDYVTPDITGVTDNRGDVPEGGKTRDPEVTIKGTATRGETVELFDGLTASKGTAQVDADNTWTHKITNLTEKSYSITAKALYDANPVSSGPRTFTVRFTETPEIVSITDSRGPIAPGAVTYDNHVLVEGRATPNEKVELSGGSQPFTLDVSDEGLWEHRLVNLTFKTYTLVAKALYETEPELSPPRSFVVAQAITPTISQVTDIRGTVDNGGTTYYKTVILSGEASPNEKIELRDADTLFTTVDVKSDGTWRYEFSGLQLKSYSLKAKALYGEKPESAARTFTVAVHISPTIRSVTDSRGPVAPGGTTHDSSVTMEGSATPREDVEISHNPGVKVPVRPDGTWTARLIDLAERDYSITAKALYDVDPESSEPRTFTVKLTETPEIVSITDSRGVIASGAITYDNNVLVEGRATPNEKVELSGGSAPVTVDVSDKGLWSHRLNNLTVKTYTLIAKALYDIDPEQSHPYSFVVAQAVTPTISRVTDIRGTVDNGGTTYYKTVTLSGEASPNEKIELRDGNTPFITVDVKSDGTWTHEFGGLQLKSYSLKAKALYGEKPESAARTFTVAAHISPTITKVTDSKGTVAHGGITYDNSVNMEGEATPREEVEISHNPGVKVTVQNNGIWTARLTGLSVRSYSIKAKALYAVVPVESAPRNFEVRAHTAVTLTSVRDNLGEVPQNGQTISTTVSLQGAVTPLHSVQIYDNSSPKHTVVAQSNGIWTTSLAVGIGGHSVNAKAVSTGQFSNSRGFTVKSPIPPLIISPAQMILSAWHFRDLNTPTTPPSGAFGDRTPTSGQPPYRYESSNPNIAEVHPSTGRVISKGNGSATITVIDGAQQRASYPVATSNVDLLFGTGHFNTYGYCSSAAGSMGGRIPSVAEWAAFIRNYGGIRTIERWCWTSDSGGWLKGVVIYPATGQTDTRPVIGNAGGTADGFGIRRA
ncbi:MAG: hypothetical protein ABWZ65_21280 [Pseudomonas mandelii]